MWLWGSCYYTIPGCGWLFSAGGGGEVEESRRLGHVERGQDLLLTGSEHGALRDVAFAGGEGDQVETVEFVADVAPGVAGGVLHDSDQQQGQPAQLDVGADPVLAIMEHGAQAEGAFHVTPASLDGEQLFVGRRQVLGREGEVGGS